MNRKNTTTAHTTSATANPTPDTTTDTARTSFRRRIALAGAAALAVAAFASTCLGVAHAAGLGDAAQPGEVVVINSNTDPTGALNALKLYPNGTNQSFTPTVEPSYATTAFKRVDGPDGNALPAVVGDGTTQETLTVSHQDTSSWSLGGSIQTSVGFDLLGAVDAQISEKFTASHTWQTSTSDAESVTVKPLAGKTVWLEASDSDVTYTGTFTFDVAGVRYEVENVTITQPAAAGVDANSATTYRVQEIATANTGAAPGVSGKVSMSKLPKLQTYINSGH